MRRSYIESPLRLPAARNVLKVRSRGLPVLLAFPLVAILWMTIGLPLLAEVAGAVGSNRSLRDTAFEASGGSGGAGGSGSQERRDPATRTVVAVSFAPSVVRAVEIELQAAQAARSGGSDKTFGSGSRTD